MTVSNRVQDLSLAAAALVVACLSACSKATNATPRVSTIPSQTATGGTPFALDLSPWAKAPSGQTLTYSVRSGGGSVTGSTYSNTFDTVGRKTVELTAHTTGDAVDFDFIVDVLTASEAVLQAGTSLVLLDRGTVNNVTGNLATGSFYSTNFITITNSQGYTDTFMGALTRGHVIYERTIGSDTDLYMFNPNSPATTQLGDDPNSTTDEKFEAKTTDNRVIFTSGVAADPDLYIYSVETGLTREISAVANSLERNAVVDANDIIYFERGPTAQRDIYSYDPATDALTTISTDSTNEIIQGVTGGGGVVFTRDLGAGDIDLWYFKLTTGLTQVAADVATPGFQAGTLTYKGSSPNGKVIFEHTISGADTDLYYWDPDTLTTTVVATNFGVRDDYDGVTSNNQIIYTHEVSGADWDVHSHVIGGADTDLSGNATVDVFQAITSLNDVVILAGGTTLRVWDDSASSATDVDTGAVMTFQTALPDGNVVYDKAGTGVRRWLSAGGVATVSATGSFAGELSGGNFVVKITVSTQDDLWFWNEATDTLTVAANDANDEKYVAATTSNDAFVFSRANTASKYELFVWDPTAGVRSLSNTGLTHTHVANYALDNR